MLPWECRVIYFLTVCIVPRRNALANDAGWRALCRTIDRLDKWNTYCALVMPDHIHLLTAPLERELSVAAFLKWLKRWFNELYDFPEQCRWQPVDLIAFFAPRNQFTRNGTIFERTLCARAWSSIGSSGLIARDFSMMKSEIVGRLIRSLPLTRPPACPSMSLGARRSIL